MLFGPHIFIFSRDILSQDQINKVVGVQVMEILLSLGAYDIVGRADYLGKVGDLFLIVNYG